jgi:hypothetical protein
MDANEPEKKIPSTAAKAMILSPKVAVVEPIHFNAHSAFCFTHGTEEKQKKSMIERESCAKVVLFLADNLHMIAFRVTFRIKMLV